MLNQATLINRHCANYSWQTQLSPFTGCPRQPLVVQWSLSVVEPAYTVFGHYRQVAVFFLQD